MKATFRQVVKVLRSEEQKAERWYSRRRRATTLTAANQDLDVFQLQPFFDAVEFLFDGRECNSSTSANPFRGREKQGKMRAQLLPQIPDSAASSPSSRRPRSPFDGAELFVRWPRVFFDAVELLFDGRETLFAVDFCGVINNPSSSFLHPSRAPPNPKPHFHSFSSFLHPVFHFICNVVIYMMFR